MILSRFAVFVVILEVVVLARQDGVDHNADEGGDGQAGEVQRELADVEGDCARGGEGDAQRQRDNQGDDDDIAPMVPVGIAETSAANFGQKDAMIAYTAARRMTSGSYTRVSARTPVFSP